MAESSLRLLGSLAARVEHLAVSTDGFDPGSTGPSVFHGIARDGDSCAEWKITRTNFPLHECAGALSFEAPSRHGTIFVGDVDQQPGVRIGVLKLLHSAFKRDFFCAVEHHTRVIIDRIRDADRPTQLSKALLR